MRKLTKKQKEYIKSKLFKVLHIVCYVLSACFVTMAILVGVQSCANKHSNNAVSTNTIMLPRMVDVYEEEQSYSYTNKQGLSIVIEDLNELNIAYDIPIDVMDTGDSIGKTITLTSSVKATNVSSGTNDYYNKIRLIFARKSNGYNYYYRLTTFMLLGDTNFLLILNGINYNYNNMGYVEYLYNSTYLIESTNYLDDYAFNQFFSLVKKQDFTFNKQFNYNAPIGLTLNSPFGSTTTDAPETISDRIFRWRYDVGLFVSNGVYYNQIVIDYEDANGNSYLINNYLNDGTSGALSYFALGYRRVDNNFIEFVNYRELGVYSSGTITNKPYTLDSSTWVNDSYRDIVFYNISDSLKVKVNAFNNNNQYGAGGYVGAGNINDVFSLVASAFTAWLPVMSISLLPGITLGTLLFIPLVAILVFAIIKVIKK